LCRPSGNSSLQLGAPAIQWGKLRQQWLHVTRRLQSPPIAPPAPGSPHSSRRRWLLLAHQLPATPSNLRVRTWRRLQDLGALAIKQSVYVLPDSPESREDFEWLRVEIEGSGGEAVVLSANHLDAEPEAALVEEFRRSRQTAYADLAAELQRIRPKKGGRAAQSRLRGIARYRQRFQAIERIDFFGGAGRDRVASLLAALESKDANVQDEPSSAGRSDAAQYKGRLWVTRPRPGVDRMSSAWLIRRFIDPAASFDFVTDARNAPPGAVPFDMYGTGFSHDADRCTFETLTTRFAINDQAVSRLGKIVHDLDLKDGKHGAPETVTLGAAIDGLQMSCGDDRQLLDQGIILFEAMYRSFSQQARPPRPRVVAKAQRSRSRRK
jgi:hypothetical protein